MRNHPIELPFRCIFCLLLISCGTSTQTDRMPISTPPSSQPTVQPSATPSLPPTAAIDYTGLRLLEVIFRTQLNVNRLDDLYATTRGKVQHISVVSAPDLDVLKGFVANGWAPVVLLHSGGRGLWAVIEYDDMAQQVQVQNPISRVVRTFTTADFEKEWITASGQKCVLVTPGRLSEERVHSALGKYLSAEQVAQITVRSR